MRPRYIPQCKEVTKHWKARMPLVTVSSCANLIRSIMGVEKIENTRTTQPEAISDLTKDIAISLVMIEALREHYHISEGMIEYEIEKFLCEKYPMHLDGHITAKKPSGTIFGGGAVDREEA